MKKSLTIVCFFLLICSFSNSADGRTNSPTYNDLKLKELSNQFSTMQATWGRFQIGGTFDLESDSSLEDHQTKLPTFGFIQQLKLFLDASMDQNLQLSLKASHQGGWGLNQTTNSGVYPMTSPFQVDEAFLKLEYPNSLYYMGRFRYSFGPLGLISDFYTNPLEGVALQRTFHNFHAIGIYSRVNTQYDPNTNQIETVDNYLAGRIGWSNQLNIIGLNMVPKGISGEKSISADWAYNRLDLKMAMEVGWYSFNNNQYPNYKVAWVPGILASYGKVFNNFNYFQLKAGYLAPKFMPSYSSLAHCSGDDREWFLPNSQGVEIYLQTGLKKGFSLENRLIILKPVENLGQPILNYRWRSALVKNFSAINQLQFGFDLKYMPNNIDHIIFGKWTLQF